VSGVREWRASQLSAVRRVAGDEGGNRGLGSDPDPRSCPYRCCHQTLWSIWSERGTCRCVKWMLRPPGGIAGHVTGLGGVPQDVTDGGLQAIVGDPPVAQDLPSDSAAADTGEAEHDVLTADVVVPEPQRLAQ
jgi:hypothetical protein